MTQFVVGHLSPKEVTWDAASAPSATALILIEPAPVADPRPLKSPHTGHVHPTRYGVEPSPSRMLRRRGQIAAVTGSKLVSIACSALLIGSDWTPSMVARHASISKARCRDATRVHGAAQDCAS